MLKSMLPIVAFLLAVPTLGRAQASSSSVAPAPTQGPVARPCIAAIPDSEFMRVPVFVTLAMGDSARFTIPAAAMTLVRAATLRMLASLGVKPPATLDSLTPGEPRFTWDSIGRGVFITRNRDGRLSWALDENHDPQDRSSETLARLFGQALDSVQASGDANVPWPAQLDADSVVMYVGFERPKVRPLWKVEPVKTTVAFPLFSVAAPMETPVSVLHPPREMYPRTLLYRGVSGNVLMEFAVDTLGRADTLTMHDVWPAGRPRLTGKKASYYGELVATARYMASHATYTPATTGGCKVRQVVQQPFNWGFR